MADGLWRGVRTNRRSSGSATCGESRCDVPLIRPLVSGCLPLSMCQGVGSTSVAPFTSLALHCHHLSVDGSLGTGGFKISVSQFY